MSFLSIILFLLISYVLSYSIALVVHEAGHAIVGRMRGCCVAYITFGNKRIFDEDATDKDILKFSIAKIPIFIQSIFPTSGYVKFLSTEALPKVNDVVYVSRNSKGEAVDFIISDEDMLGYEPCSVKEIKQEKQTLVFEVETKTGPEYIHFPKRQKDKMAEQATKKDLFLITLAGPLINLIIGTLIFAIKYLFFSNSEFLVYLGACNLVFGILGLSSSTSDGKKIRDYLRTRRKQKAY
ncbi:site-2 protease family protein [Bacillus bombysepticus]|uniref:site-2 protease family protein n=1 Tax=Bacillus bombysepticus TaxID=658666 RepID=UPI00301A3155